MVEWIVVAVVVVVAVIVVLAAMKPDSFRVERSTTIAATPENIFPLISDFRRWPEWSPWEKKDPRMKKTLSGEPTGKGAVYAWRGDKNVGIGRMEIVGEAPPSRLAIALDFEKPFEAHNVVDFTLTPGAGATRVTWAMHGPANFVSKLMQVFMSFDRMIGKDFESGLASLKALAER